MEPVTHLLTGACLARAGFNRKTAYATLAMVLAAEAPDVDMFWEAAGPVSVFEHHRGWTHAFIGAPVVAGAVVGSIWLWHRWSSSRPPKPVAAQPGHVLAPPLLRPKPRWGLLWLFSILAVLSHILLDYTNSYGIRPFYPFNPRWYSADIVFIFDPVILAVLLLALIAPWLFSLADTEIGARRQPYRGRGWAIFALVAVALLWTWRASEHQHALSLLRAQNYSQNGQSQPLLRVAAEPFPGNPFHWRGIAETPNSFELADVNTRTDAVETDSEPGLFYKPPTTAAVLAAKRSLLGRVYMDWSQYPYVQGLGARVADAQSGLVNAPTAVRFTDLRFLYRPLPTSSDEASPLSGVVLVNADHQVVEMEMDGRAQK
ncbi:MAG: metal-dependent hydrolase [Acidobacteriaceae bacterium]